MYSNISKQIRLSNVEDNFSRECRIFDRKKLEKLQPALIFRIVIKINLIIEI